jgi:hypothetical protein
LDTTRGLLTEYSLSNPTPSRITGIDNALTLALAGNRAWFTELTANCVGYVDPAYTPDFALSNFSNADVNLRPGNSLNVTAVLSRQSSKPLTVLFADTENYTSLPQGIAMAYSMERLASSPDSEVFVVKFTAARTIPPGDYTLLVTVTDGLTNQGAYLRLHVRS